jgi:RNA polymerase sigma-70 factor (ECF subfamily)
MMATPTYDALKAQQDRFDRIFRQELQPLMDAICSFAYRLTNDRTAADDLVQETYLKAWRFIDRYQEGTNARAWMFCICRNAFINDYRTKRPDVRVVEMEQASGKSVEEIAQINWLENFSNDLTDVSLSDETTQALKRLSDNYRMVILLDMEDFTYEEIAAIVGIPVGTVRSRLHRARLDMAKQLRTYALSQGYNVQDKEAPTKSGRITKKKQQQP